MSDPRHDFLQAIGATLNGDECAFAHEPTDLRALDGTNVIVPLSHYGLLEVRGPDAEKFLQGQITCSAAEVSPTLSAPGAYCTAKGRVVTSFQLLRPEPERFLLRMRRDLLDIAARTFGKYIVFSKAKLNNSEMLGIGFYGAQIPARLRELIGALPAQHNGTVSHGDGLLLQCDNAATQFEFWGPPAAVRVLWDQCAQHSTAAGTRFWRWLNIRAGSAEVCAATSEVFLPHMLNYHVTGAINFKKGCYTGQEIVARTHYRGQVKRHLLRAALYDTSFDIGSGAGAPLPAGAELIDAGGKTLGNIVDCVAIDTQTAELLAVGGSEALAATNVKLALDTTKPGSDGAELRPLELPYAIP